MTDARTAKISDYGLIGDSRACALVSRFGSIDWGCFPRFDSPSFFDALIDDGEGGFFSVRPAVPFKSCQCYVPMTNVLETTYRCADGAEFRVRDAFSATSEERKRGRLWPNHEILRVIEGIRGEAPFEIRFYPRAHYGKCGLHLRKVGGWAVECLNGSDLLILQTSFGNSPFRIDKHARGTEARCEIVVREGETVALSLTYSEEAPAVLAPLGPSALERIAETERYWRDWIDQCRYDGMYEGHVRRSALALKLLEFAPSGAVVAAPTTSLPEVVGGPRNWDYRYCWLRDASFTARAWIRLGFLEEARAYVNWLLHTTRLTQPHLQILYSVYGEATLPERELPWLRGYRDSRPVRVGNRAAIQRQFDTYGEVMSALYTLIPHLEYVDNETKSFVRMIGEEVCDRWRLPDNGIWEMRSDVLHHTHSKVHCWVALDRAIQIARSQGWSRSERFIATAEEIRTDIEAHGYNAEVGSYTRAYGGSELDASLLILPLVGYCDVNNKRMRGTIEAIRKTLAVNHLLYRYRPGTDGIAAPEGAFCLCNFWMARNCALMGRMDEAKLWFEAVCERASDTGLLSEEIDPVRGELLGNFPQAFTHIGLINAALTMTQIHKGTRVA